jgi:hypothetical protein
MLLDSLSTLQDFNGKLILSGFIPTIDQTDKVMIAYQLGMGLTEYVAEVKLSIPWLMHLDPLIKNRRVIILSGSKRRPDLVGQDAKNNWHVIEAKGSTGTIENGTKASAKIQASRIVSIDGQTPATRAASLISLGKCPIYCEVIDPDEEQPDPVKLEIGEKTFYSAYYEPLISLI